MSSGGAFSRQSSFLFGELGVDLDNPESYSRFDLHPPSLFEDYGLTVPKISSPIPLHTVAQSATTSSMPPQMAAASTFADRLSDDDNDEDAEEDDEEEEEYKPTDTPNNEASASTRLKRAVRKVSRSFTRSRGLSDAKAGIFNLPADEIASTLDRIRKDIASTESKKASIGQIQNKQERRKKNNALSAHVTRQMVDLKILEQRQAMLKLEAQNAVLSRENQLLKTGASVVPASTVSTSTASVEPSADKAESLRSVTIQLNRKSQQLLDAQETHRKEIHALTTKSRRTENQLTRANEDYQHLRQKVTQQSSQHNDVIQQLNGTIAQLRAQLAVQPTQPPHHALPSKLEQQQQQLMQTHAQILAELADVKQHHAKLQAERVKEQASHAKIISTLEAEIQSLKLMAEKRSDNESFLKSKYTKNIEIYQVQNNSLRQRVAQQTTNLADKQKEIDDLTRVLARTEEELQDVQALLEKHCNEQEVLASRAQRTIAGCTSTLSEIRTANQEMENQMDKLRAENAALRSIQAQGSVYRLVHQQQQLQVQNGQPRAIIYSKMTSAATPVRTPVREPLPSPDRRYQSR